MIELTQEQRQALRENGASTTHVVDPDTNTEYVLVRADVYARLAGLLSDDFQPSEAYPAIDRAFAEGWDDPKMADYDRYEELRK